MDVSRMEEDGCHFQEVVCDNTRRVRRVVRAEAEARFARGARSPDPGPHSRVCAPRKARMRRCGDSPQRTECSKELFLRPGPPS